MNFVIIANAWSASSDNPTSKHQIALELARQGHRVLWMEGAGMRRPSLGTGADRRRILRRLVAVFQGATRIDDSFNREFDNSSIRELGDSDPSENSSSSVPRGVPGTESSNRPIIESSVPRGDMWVLSPLLIPFPSIAWVRRFNGWLYAALGKLWARRLGFEDPVLINYVPVLAEAMRRWRITDCGLRNVECGAQITDHKGKDEMGHQVSTVYYCVDRWDAFDMYDSMLMADLDTACCEYADVVIASSRDLYERCKRYNPNTRLITHGVNYEHFAKAIGQKIETADLRRSTQMGERPKDLPEGKIIGFFGLLSEWIDQDLIVKLAAALRSGVSECPEDASVVLIGEADVPIDRLKAEPNVCLLGPKSYAELPFYVAWFDVGIIPFVVNDLTRAVNPIKLREMLAAGCPVISTALPEVAGYVAAVSIARNHEEFVSSVRERIRKPLTAAEKRTISERVKGETWETKVGEIVEIVGRAIGNS